MFQSVLQCLPLSKHIIAIIIINLSSGVLGSSFRHYARSRKVAGSVSDEATGIFNLPNPSSSTMIVGYTQPPTEINNINLPVGKSSRCVRLRTWQPPVSQWSRLVVFNRGYARTSYNNRNETQEAFETLLKEYVA
jgi:hypothetical protein